jgi:uncharacterized membrane protein
MSLIPVLVIILIASENALVYVIDTTCWFNLLVCGFCLGVLVAMILR